MTIEFSASMGEKSRPIKKPIHAVWLLTRQFNPEIYDLVLNAAVNFVILAFADR